MILVRCEIPVEMVQKLKAILHTKRYDGLLIDTNDMEIKYLMVLIHLQSC